MELADTSVRYVLLADARAPLRYYNTYDKNNNLKDKNLEGIIYVF